MGLSVSDISRLGPAAQKQVLEKMRSGASKAPPPTGKYHNCPTVRLMANGEEHMFPSIKEARRYDELMMLLRAGQIRDLKLQPQFTLQESYITAEGNRVRAIKYVADFSYVKQNGTTVVEDVKSSPTKTRVYKIKIKLMQEKFGICVREV